MKIKNAAINSLVGLAAIVSSCGSKKIVVDNIKYEVTKEKKQTTIETGTYFAKTIIDMENDGTVDFYTLTVDYPDADEKLVEQNYGKNIPKEIQEEYTKVIAEYNRVYK